MNNGRLLFLIGVLVLIAGLYIWNALNRPLSLTDVCVENWYRQNPETRPENQKPGWIYLAPPCPGVPQ
ncbi:hypothetical protein HY374_02385 [Candidatus Berkelbacteria bacterium]|nr:hypothetical protein [Candidatus Berkelbacteria bacterium]